MENRGGGVFWISGVDFGGRGGLVFGSSAASLPPSLFLRHRRGCSLIGKFRVRQIT